MKRKVIIRVRDFVGSSNCITVEDGEINDITNKIMSLIKPYIHIDREYKIYHLIFGIFKQQ